MIRSMTGFGRADDSADGWHCNVELRSVNNRYLEIRFKLPQGMTYIEEELKNILKKRLGRGKIDCTIILTPEDSETGGLVWNETLLRQYSKLLDSFQDIIGREIEVTLGNLTNIKELIQPEGWEKHRAAVEPLLRKTLGEAVEKLMSMREREGAALKEDLLSHLEAIGGQIDLILPMAKGVPENQAKRLRDNLKRLLDKVPVNEERLAQEIAITADRYDVSEEITRGKTHLDHLEHMLREGGEMGRKFDFLLQEVNREANTLSAKSNDAEISARVVEIKSLVEKLREQIQNIE